MAEHQAAAGSGVRAHRRVSLSLSLSPQLLKPCQKLEEEGDSFFPPTFPQCFIFFLSYCFVSNGFYVFVEMYVFVDGDFPFPMGSQQ